jgi:hypothetical protein
MTVTKRCTTHGPTPPALTPEEADQDELDLEVWRQRLSRVCPGCGTPAIDLTTGICGRCGSSKSPTRAGACCRGDRSVTQVTELETGSIAHLAAANAAAAPDFDRGSFRVLGESPPIVGGMLPRVRSPLPVHGGGGERRTSPGPAASPCASARRGRALVASTRIAHHGATVRQQPATTRMSANDHDR